MSELLESGQAALVVVASDRDGLEIEHLLLDAERDAHRHDDWRSRTRVCRGVFAATHMVSPP